MVWTERYSSYSSYSSVVFFVELTTKSTFLLKRIVKPKTRTTLMTEMKKEGMVRLYSLIALAMESYWISVRTTKPPVGLLDGTLHSDATSPVQYKGRSTAPSIRHMIANK